jgi:hypothetical protein
MSRLPRNTATFSYPRRAVDRCCPDPIERGLPNLDFALPLAVGAATLPIHMGKCGNLRFLQRVDAAFSRFPAGRRAALRAALNPAGPAFFLERPVDLDQAFFSSEGRTIRGMTFDTFLVCHLIDVCCTCRLRAAVRDFRLRRVVKRG